MITQQRRSINWASFTRRQRRRRYDGRIARRKKAKILSLTLDNDKASRSGFRCCSVTRMCSLVRQRRGGITAETATLPAPFSVTEALMKDGEIDVQSHNVKNAWTVVRI